MTICGVQSPPRVKLSLKASSKVERNSKDFVSFIGKKNQTWKLILVTEELGWRP